MKKFKNLKIFIFIVITLFLMVCFWFFVFYNDPFIKLAPENTKIYSLININQKFKQQDVDKIFSLRNINVNKILENKEFKNIKKDYINKISFFVTNDNNFYIILKKKFFIKNPYIINYKKISKDINNYLNLNIELESYNLDNFVILTNNKNPKDLVKKKYIFFFNVYKKIILEKEFDFIINKNLIKTFVDSGYINNQIQILTKKSFYDYFTKDYSLLNLKIVNGNFDLSLSNLKNNNNYFSNNYSVDYLKDNHVIINDFNIFNLLNSFFNNYKDKNLNSSENLNYLLKNLTEDGFDNKTIERIFSNNCSLFINLKDSNINLNNISSFLFLIKLDNLNNYIDDIKRMENIFLKKFSLDNIKTENIFLPDGTLAKEEFLDYENLKFKTEKSNNKNIEYDIKFLKNKDFELYYSLINKDGILLISNKKEMISSLNNKFTEYSFIIKNLKINILAKIKQNKLNIIIK